LADQGELLVRIGTVLLCLFLPFIALPLSLRDEKSLKILHVFTAVLIFLAANHFLGIFQALIIKGFISLFFSLFLIPIIIVTLASFLIFNNENK
jgi:lipopolysaccharide export LptBFGC system permease protein LptF